MEYRQLAYTAAELSWLRSLFKDLHLHLVKPTIWCDNVSSIALASNPVFHSRTKHLEVDYHYVKEKVVRGQLLVNFICSRDQIAALFYQRTAVITVQVSGIQASSGATSCQLAGG